MIISKENWKKIGASKMEKNYCEACGASGSKLKTEGIINSNVSFRGKTSKVKAYIVQGLSLNLLELAYNFLGLWEESINSICQSVKFAYMNIGILKKKIKQKY